MPIKAYERLPFSFFVYPLENKPNMCYNFPVQIDLKRYKMIDYLLIVLSALLLAVCFILQKLFQTRTVDTTESSVEFSIMSAIFSIIMLIITSGFSISFTPYSAINVLLRSTCCLVHTVLGFKIMKAGSVALHMLFLMSGGMLVPAVWGWVFLNEDPKPLHIIGLVVILASIVLNNLGSGRPSVKVLLMCITVFIVNGLVSVFAKLHQVETVYETVSTADYTLLSSVASLVMSLALRAALYIKNKGDRIKSNCFRLFPMLIIVISGVVSTASSLLQLEGAKNLPASMLFPLQSGGTIVFSGLLALIFFGEKLSKRGWAAIGLCVVGTCLFI